MCCAFFRSFCLRLALAELTCIVALLMLLPVRTSADDDAIAYTDQASIITREGLRSGFTGDLDSRARALQHAIEADPGCALAHWHRAEILVQEQWQTISTAARRIAADLSYAEYQALRDRALADPEGELALADWCAKHQIPDAERLHLYRVVSDSPDGKARQQAVQRLDLQLYQGVLLPRSEVQSLQQQAAVLQQQLLQWLPVVRQWAAQSASRGGDLPPDLHAQMAEQVDAAAIPAIEQVFSTGGEPLALEAVALIGNLGDHEATVSLARHSIGSPWPAVRASATEKLKLRPLHDYAPLLLHLLEAPIQSRFYVGVDANGIVRHEHYFYREGAQENQLLESSFNGGPKFVKSQEIHIRGAAWPGPAGDAARERLAKAQQLQRRERYQAAAVREQVLVKEAVRAKLMEQEVALANQRYAAQNERIHRVLEETSGVIDLDHLPAAWWEWWQKYNEVYLGPKPTYTRQYGRVDAYYVPSTHITQLSCFPAGTPVRTLTGKVNIEQIRAGDRVLSQNPETGELTYKLVLQTTVRPPSDLLEVTMGQSALITTQGHLCWVNGTGWRMAKELWVGDQIHTIAGGERVQGIRPAGRAEAFNLVVADFNSYFVGDAGVLVHDNTYRKPSRALTPGLLAGEP